MLDASVGRVPFAAPVPVAESALGNTPEQVRLIQRAKRLQQVLNALRERRLERSRVGPPPAALLEAIKGFTLELAQVKQRCRVEPLHTPVTPPIHGPEGPAAR